MNDLEIAHTAYTAGGIDIRYAHLALAVSENDAVNQTGFTGDVGVCHSAAILAVSSVL